jgi:N-acyl-D-aspartate/D-glutamate deacylase
MSIFKEVSAADLEGKKRIYADRAWREQFRTRLGGSVFAKSWTETVVSDHPPDPSLNERNVVEAARERGVDPTDFVLDLSLETNLETRFRMAVLNTDETAVAELLTHPATMLGLSDAGAHASQLCDACFSTHLLSHWVRAKGALSLEHAVRLLTSRSADVFGIRDRGRLTEGLAADVTVFDARSVACSPLRRVHDLPAGADRLVADAHGVRAVIVNGKVIRENDRDVVTADEPLPGRVIRGNGGKR